MNKSTADISASEVEGSASALPSRRDPKHQDDPVRFSAVYRMFEAKSAPPKIEKGVTANAEAARKPPPSNRLKSKKVHASTMTDFDDVNDDDTLQADNACGSSTFDQQTEIDDDWLRQNDVIRPSNSKKLNEATSSTSDAHGGRDRSDLEGDHVSADGATWEKAPGGKVTKTSPVEAVMMPSYENHLVAGKSRTSIFPESKALPSVERTGKEISAAGFSEVRPVTDYAYDNVEISNPHGSNLTNHEQKSNKKSGVTPPTVQDDYKSFGVNSSEGEKHASTVYQGQAGTVASDHNQGMSGARIKCTAKSGNICDQMDNSNTRPTHSSKTSPTHQSMKPCMEESDEEFDTCRFRVSESRLGTASGSNNSSYEPVEIYENAVPSKSQQINPKAKRGYQNDSTEIGNGATTKYVVEKSTGKCQTSDEEKETHISLYDEVILSGSQQQQQKKFHSVVPSKFKEINSKETDYPSDSTETGNRSTTKYGEDESIGKCQTSDEENQIDEGLYDDVTLPGVQPHQQQKFHSVVTSKSQRKRSTTKQTDADLYDDVTLPGIQPQQQQKFHSAAGRHPSELVPPGSKGESETRKHASSSSSAEDAETLGRNSNASSMLQSANEDQCNSNKEAVQKREVSRTYSSTGPRVAPKDSIRKSMSTNTETEYLSAKTSVELECQTDSFDDVVPQPTRSVRDQSTESDNEHSLEKYDWYFGYADRELSEAILEHMINEPGSYLVRNSQRGGDGNPYTLSVVYLKRVYHLLIRQRSDGMFAIGKEKLEEKVFFSVPDLITFYRNNFVELIGDSFKKTPSGKVQLKTCPRK